MKAPKVTERMLEAAQALMATLDEKQAAAAQRPFEDEERFEWTYVPHSRVGLTLKAMSEEQRGLMREFLQGALSQRGYWKASTIIELELVLREIEGRDWRDPELYYLTVFGEPRESGTWGWRFEGHHLSLNFTIVNGSMLATTPRFLGTNPAHVLQGERKGLRVLAKEEDLGRELATSLSGEQRKKAFFRDTAPHDIVTRSAAKVDPLEPAGIRMTELGEDQRLLLMSLIDEYVSTMPEEVAAARWSKLKEAGIDEIRFAWAGSLERREGHYYRVQGPTFLIEYDNVQNQANHVHTVWRDFDGDYGRDLLREHYEEHPHPHDH